MAKRTIKDFLFGISEVRSEPLPGVVPPIFSNTESVTVQTALSVSAVYSAVNILTTWISQMELAVYRAGTQLDTPTFIRQPDAFTSGYQFIKKTVTSLALDGNAFWLVSRNQAGVVNNIEVLNPFSVFVEQDDNGKISYRVATTDGDRTYTARQVRHIMTTEVPGRLRGLGPVEANNAGLRASVALRKYADNWFSDSRGVRQHITTDFTMDPEQLAEYTRRVQAQKAANNGDLITDAGTKITNLALNPSEAMWLEQQTFGITEIARWFGIPPYLLLASVDGNSMTYSNLQTDSRLFVTNTLMSYMMPIQEAFSSLLPNGQTVKFKTESLLQGDTQERWTAYATAISSGILTVNEVREKEGLAPLAQPTKPVPNTTEGDNLEAA